MSNNHFELLKQEEVKDCAGTLYTYQHTKTKTQLLYLKRNDQNKTFAITFKTLPSNDTGVFHILEHSVLNGSAKYPVKEPFVELLKSSMQTFLNAFTAPDKTMYPVSSRNDKDFKNLMDVYLDAVFHPAIYTNPNIFYQEGWHYEIEDVQDQPTYKGVVFNEMKGAFSSVDEIIVDELNRMLFTDNCYRFVSGGDPKYITDLSYEQFIATHKKYYHPSNARVWLDGDLDINSALAQIDSYLDAYEEEKVDFSIPMQKVNPSQKHVCEYEVNEGEPLENRTHISIAKIVSDTTQVEKNLAWACLSNVLVANNESLLKKRILRENLGQDVELDIYTGIQQPWAVLTIRNTEEENLTKIQEVIKQTVQDLIDGQLNHEEISAVLNQMEFKYWERSEPAGLMYAERAMTSWLYEQDPMLYLQRGHLFNSLREKLNSNYFEDLLKEFFFDEEHQQTVIVKPSTTAQQKRLQLEQEKLTKAKESWNDVQAYVDLNQQLQTWQAQLDTKEELDTLPKLTLEDVNKEPISYPYSEEKVMGLPVILHPAEDTNIVYMNLYFNLAGIQKQYLPSLGFYTSLFTNLPTEHYNLQQLQQELANTCGDFTVFLDAYSNANQPKTCYPVLGVSVSTLQKNLDKACTLLEEIILHTKFEKDTILPLLKQENEDFRQDLVMSGQSIAMRRLASQYTSEGVFRECVGGYTSGVYTKELEENYEEMSSQFIEECQLYTEVLFSKQRLTASITGQENMKALETIIMKLHDIDANRARVMYPLNPKQNESLVIPAGISYSAYCTNVCQHDYEIASPYQVAAHILTYGWLWNEVRVKGGAYGTGFGINPNGNVSAYSYRDPDPNHAIKAMQQCGQYLLQAKDEIDLPQMIIGSIAAGEPLLSPSSFARVTDSFYFRNLSYEQRKENRQKTLAMTSKQLEDFATILNNTTNDSTVCIVGSKEQIDTCSLPLEELKQL